MALASADDVAQALERDLTSTESDYVDTKLATASDLVIGYLRCEAAGLDPVPDAVRRVVADMVAAVLSGASSAPANADSVTAGPYSVKYTDGSTSRAPYLTAALKMRLEPFRCGSMRSVPLVSERFTS